MLLSLAFIFIIGLGIGAICSYIKIPKIIGMLITGIIGGPHILNLFDSNILTISGDLRKIALIIILLKAGFALDINDLKNVGRPAIFLSFLPATFEILAYIFFAPKLLNISILDAALMGTVLAAVSPAIVVPKMINLIEKKYGTQKSIPQMILAGASIDDIFVIVLFTTFLTAAQGQVISIVNFINFPISIILGILIGAFTGLLLYTFFEYFFNKKNYIKNSTKLIIILGFAFALITLETLLEKKIAVSGLLAVISMACILKIKSDTFVSKRMSEKFGKLWIAAEVILFVLVGAIVDIRYTLMAGTPVVILIFITLIFRSLGVFLSVTKTGLLWKEKLFCAIAYLPKATVQAAISSVPLSLGLASGNIILSVAVISIIITAPLGAFGIDSTYKKLLNKN